MPASSNWSVQRSPSAGLVGCQRRRVRSNQARFSDALLPTERNRSLALAPSGTRLGERIRLLRSLCSAAVRSWQPVATVTSPNLERDLALAGLLDSSEDLLPPRLLERVGGFARQAIEQRLGQAPAILLGERQSLLEDLLGSRSHTAFYERDDRAATTPGGHEPSATVTRSGVTTRPEVSTQVHTRRALTPRCLRNSYVSYLLRSGTPGLGDAAWIDSPESFAVTSKTRGRLGAIPRGRDGSVRP